MLNLHPTKSGVRFEWSDADSETVVTLDKSEDEETIVRKLQKVLELAKPARSVDPDAFLDAVQGNGKQWTEHFAGRQQGPEVSGGTASFAPRPGGAWHKAPEVPERLKGEVEVIGEGEQ